MTLIEAIDSVIESTIPQLPLTQLYLSGYLEPGEYGELMKAEYGYSFAPEFTFLWLILVIEGYEK